MNKTKKGEVLEKIKEAFNRNQNNFSSSQLKSKINNKSETKSENNDESLKDIESKKSKSGFKREVIKISENGEKKIDEEPKTVAETEPVKKEEVSSPKEVIKKNGVDLDFSRKKFEGKRRYLDYTKRFKDSGNLKDLVKHIGDEI